MIQQSRDEFEKDLHDQTEVAKQLSMKESKMIVPEEFKTVDPELKAQITNKIENDDIQKALAESAKA